MKKVIKFWAFALAGTLIVGYYPLYMGYKVIVSMSKMGYVMPENFPKYIIPYTPITLAIIAAILFLPLICKIFKRFAVLVSTTLSMGVFVLTEWLFESKVLILTNEFVTPLDNWQMLSCYVNLDDFRKKTAIDILLGEYSPTFKLHFYLISVILIISIVSCVYGFAKVIETRNKSKIKALTVQAVCTVMFLGLCIFACFTAFFRNGSVVVSPLSAVLMCLFFIIMGLTAGLYTGTLLLGKRKSVSIVLPALIASVVTLLMYIGEMCLLSGSLYRFGYGFFFNGLPLINFAPVDIAVIVFSGLICSLILKRINIKRS